MLVVQSTDIPRLHRFLRGLKDGRALSHAAKDGLNTSAFATRREWEKQGRATMNVRNFWTFGGRNSRVIKARATRNIMQMQAVVGNKLKYMAEQERGVSRFAMRRHGVPIPMTKARISNKKTRLMRRMYWRNRMQLGKRYKRAGSREQYIAMNIKKAKASGSNFVYLDMGSWGRGIYDVRTKTKMKKVWNMNRRFTRTKANPMLRRSLRTLRPAFPQYHKSALEGQIRFLLKKRGLRPSQSTAVISRLLR